MIVILME